MMNKPQRPDWFAWRKRLLAWIVETGRDSHLARLSTIGLYVPRYTEPNVDDWRQGMWLGAA